MPKQGFIGNQLKNHMILLVRNDLYLLIKLYLETEMSSKDNKILNASNLVTV